ncbi:MAG: hypothetical protein OSB43_08410 [Nocardioides sp.]|uniref:hypothetical protein n=1 Tax=Nocardioides sp. TaxID=35761 RepID=UPI0023A613DB|nr:hypothetical protein [Nocardioides sp.]MDE0776281.1 hypothetical protein [Nocardioides sp.]
MSQQTIKQQARRTAREVAERRRLARVEKERRMTDLAEQVMVAIGERDQAVVAAETRAGAALRDWTEVEGLTLAEMVEWCDGLLTPREATRLRRLADDSDDDSDEGQAGERAAEAGDQPDDRAGVAPKGDLSGGAGGGSTAG